MSRVRTATWNVEWASPISTRAQLIREAIFNLQPEVVCLTETHLNFLEQLGGYTITGGQDWGYQSATGRRKVLLWSRAPWESVRGEGPPRMPPGRFVAGITNTSVSKVLVYGVCIPWKDAHVRTGLKNKAPWEDHEAYLLALSSDPVMHQSGQPLVVLGDYNQQLPRKRSPVQMESLLRKTLVGTKIWTEGLTDEDGYLAIDHIATSPHLNATDRGVITRQHSSGHRLSDHFGVWCDFSLSGLLD